MLPVVDGFPSCCASAVVVLTPGGKDGENCADSSGGVAAAAAAAVADFVGNDCAATGVISAERRAADARGVLASEELPEPVRSAGRSSA